MGQNERRDRDRQGGMWEREEGQRQGCGRERVGLFGGGGGEREY